MTAFLTTSSDLSQFLTGLINKPLQSKARPTNADGAAAIKTAWANYRAWTLDFEKRLGEPVGKFHRAQFGMYLRQAWLQVKIAKRGPRTITLNDCLHIAGKR